MSKKELYEKAESLLENTDKKTLLETIFHYFNSDDLENFIEYLKKELYDNEI